MSLLLYALISLALCGCFGIVLGKWLRSRATPDECDHGITTRPRWSQDGWVCKCYLCDEIVYFGDDYEGGPDARGVVQGR